MGKTVFHTKKKFYSPVEISPSLNLQENKHSKKPINSASPPQPPAPKTPLELLEELKSEHVKIIVDGKEISYEQAQKQFKENTFTQINVRNVKGERPVLKVASE